MLVGSSWWCLLRRVHKIAISAYDLLHFHLSVRPSVRAFRFVLTSVCVSAASKENIYIKFDIGNFHETSVEKIQIG